jgi:putative ATP-dependent endonuclease of OLD family
MRIAFVEITNFRCIKHLRLSSITLQHLWANGAGKSTILRALNWLFNGESLPDEYVFEGAPHGRRQIQVSLTPGTGHLS